MNCSSCKNIQLEPQELEPGLVAASCPSCNGALVSLMNYHFSNVCSIANAILQ